MLAVNLVLDAPSLTCVSSLEWTRDQALSLEQLLTGDMGLACCTAPPAPHPAPRQPRAWEHLCAVTYTEDHTRVFKDTRFERICHRCSLKS